MILAGILLYSSNNLGSDVNTHTHEIYHNPTALTSDLLTYFVLLNFPSNTHEQQEKQKFIVREIPSISADGLQKASGVTLSCLSVTPSLICLSSIVYFLSQLSSEMSLRNLASSFINHSQALFPVLFVCRGDISSCLSVLIGPLPPLHPHSFINDNFPFFKTLQTRH